MRLTDSGHTAKRVAGDVGDTILVELETDEDLSGSTGCEAHVRRFTSSHTLAAAIVDTDLRHIRVQCDPWLPDLTAAGLWGLEVTVHWGTTSITYPSGTEDRISVDVRGGYDT